MRGRGGRRNAKRTLKIEKAARVGAENVERRICLFCGSISSFPVPSTLSADSASNSIEHNAEGMAAVFIQLFQRKDRPLRLETRPIGQILAAGSGSMRTPLVAKACRAQ